jgi:hypothetical protein
MQNRQKPDLSAEAFGIGGDERERLVEDEFPPQARQGECGISFDRNN